MARNPTKIPAASSWKQCWQEADTTGKRIFYLEQPTGPKPLAPTLPPKHAPDWYLLPGFAQFVPVSA